MTATLVFTGTTLLAFALSLSFLLRLPRPTGALAALTALWATMVACHFWDAAAGLLLPRAAEALSEGAITAAAFWAAFAVATAPAWLLASYMPNADREILATWVGRLAVGALCAIAAVVVAGNVAMSVAFCAPDIARPRNALTRLPHAVEVLPLRSYLRASDGFPRSDDDATSLQFQAYRWLTTHRTAPHDARE